MQLKPKLVSSIIVCLYDGIGLPAQKLSHFPTRFEKFNLEPCLPRSEVVFEKNGNKQTNNLLPQTHLTTGLRSSWVKIPFSHRHITDLEAAFAFGCFYSYLRFFLV